MGTAFVAAADDATSAFTNPAGLARLGRREIGAELRFRRLASPYLSGGSISGEPTGVGLDTVPMTDIRERHRRSVWRHISLVFLAARGEGDPHRLSSSGCRRSTTGFSIRVFFNERLSAGRTIAAATSRWRHPQRRCPQLRRSDRLSGVGSALGRRRRFRLDVRPGRELRAVRDRVRNFAGTVDRSRIDSTAVQTGDDVAAAFNAGGLFDVAPQLKVGGSFRRGPSFRFSQRDQLPSTNFDLTRIGDSKCRTCGRRAWSGVRYSRFRVLVDYNRVRYSQLKKDFIDFQAIASGRPEQLRLEDGNELHAGFEYLFLKRPCRSRFAADSGSTRTTLCVMYLRPRTTKRTVVSGDASRRRHTGALHGRTGHRAELVAGDQRRGRHFVTHQYVTLSTVVRF